MLINAIGGTTQGIASTVDISTAQVLQSSKSVDGADLMPGPVNPLLSSQPPPEQPNFADFTHFAALQFVPEAEREAAAKEARVAAQVHIDDPSE